MAAVTDSTRSDKLQPLTMTTSRPRAQVCLVRLAGELDTTTAPVLADYLREQTAAAPPTCCWTSPRCGSSPRPA